MHANILKGALVPLAALLLAGAGPMGPAPGADDAARAGLVSGSGMPCAAAARGPVLPLKEIIARLEARGFTDIYKVEWKKGAWKVKARDAEGRRAKLYLDPATGAILRLRRR